MDVRTCAPTDTLDWPETEFPPDDDADCSDGAFDREGTGETSSEEVCEVPTCIRGVYPPLSDGLGDG